MNEQRSPWREPMVWLVFGIPAATVVAGLATLAIALRAGSMDTVPSPVRRVAQAQVLASAVDDSTASKGYRGLLMLERGPASWRVRVETRPASLADAPMQLLFVHPALAKRDVRIDLRGRTAALAPAPDFIPQQIILTDTAGTWRLVGAYREQSVLDLTPALSQR